MFCDNGTAYQHENIIQKVKMEHLDSGPCCLRAWTQELIRSWWCNRIMSRNTEGNVLHKPVGVAWSLRRCCGMTWGEPLTPERSHTFTYHSTTPHSCESGNPFSSSPSPSPSRSLSLSLYPSCNVGPVQSLCLHTAVAQWDFSFFFFLQITVHVVDSDTTVCWARSMCAVPYETEGETAESRRKRKRQTLNDRRAPPLLIL